MDKEILKRAPVHIRTFWDSRDEVKRLLDIHKQIAGTTPGFKADVEVLNKSAIVLLVACWEAFVEDLATNAFDLMLLHANNPKVFPNGVLTLASRDLRADKDERKVWELAGSGWKKILTKHKSKVLEKYIGTFNTPRAENIDRLFSDLIGLPNLSHEWHWRSKSPENAKQTLSDLITLRGSIAHRVATSSSVHKSSVEKAIKFIHRVSVISHNRVNTYLLLKTKKRPWTTYYYGKVK